MNYKIDSDLLPQFGYSENKIDTGFTLDGKKVYRQVFKTTSGNNINVWNLLETNVGLILNFNFIINYDKSERYTNNYTSMNFYYQEGKLYEKHYDEYYNNVVLLIIMDFTEYENQFIMQNAKLNIIYMEYKIKLDFLLGEKRINKDDNWNTLKPGFYHVNLWGGSTHPDNGYPQESGLGILIADNYLQICLLQDSLMYVRILYEGEWKPWKANS